MIFSRRGTRVMQQNLLRASLKKATLELLFSAGMGTISEVVNATVNTEVELGIVSVGTGNDLARSFNLPYNKPEKALEVILNGGPTKVDVGWEQERCFISTLGLGFPAVIAQEANKMKYLKRSPAFFIATYKAINHLRAIPVKITLDDETLNVNCTSVLIQNTPFCGGGLLMAPAARMDDGLFDVVVVKDIGKVGLNVEFPEDL